MASDTPPPRRPARRRTRPRPEFRHFLSNMVMPNIGAFIAWGLITALFIETGWLNLGGHGNAQARTAGSPTSAAGATTPAAASSAR